MRRKYIVVLLMILAPQFGAAGEVDKTNWVNAIHNSIPNNECGESGFFSSCYSLTQDQCKIEMKKIAVQCTDSQVGEMPEKLVLPGKDQKWTEMAVNCMYKNYTEKFSSKLIQEQGCKDAVKLIVK